MEEKEEKRRKSLQIRLTDDEFDLIENSARVSGLKKAPFARRAILADCGATKSTYELLTASKNNLAIECSVLNIRIMELAKTVNELSKLERLSQSDKVDLQASFKSLKDMAGGISRQVNELSKEAKK
jgi:uncharacterized protein (DUF1778 family)